MPPCPASAILPPLPMCSALQAEGKLCSHCSLNVEIVNVFALCVFGAEIDNVFAVVGNASEGLEHQVEFSDVCEIVLAAVGAGD